MTNWFITFPKWITDLSFAYLLARIWIWLEDLFSLLYVLNLVFYRHLSYRLTVCRKGSHLKTLYAFSHLTICQKGHSCLSLTVYLSFWSRIFVCFCDSSPHFVSFTSDERGQTEKM